MKVRMYLFGMRCSSEVGGMDGDVSSWLNECLIAVFSSKSRAILVPSPDQLATRLQVNSNHGL